MIILGRLRSAKNLADVIDDGVASGAQFTNDFEFSGWFLMVCGGYMLCKNLSRCGKRGKSGSWRKKADGESRWSGEKKNRKQIGTERRRKNDPETSRCRYYADDTEREISREIQYFYSRTQYYRTTTVKPQRI
jgi:hypothetical protein